MKKEILNSSMLGYKLFLLFFVGVVVAGSAMGTTLDVCSSGCSYSSIQTAINAASAGDTILVGAGTYNENLLINKGVALYGSSLATITGMHAITASNVVVDGFTLDISGSGTTITIDSSASAINNIKISNNLFELTTPPSIGVYLGGETPNNLVSDIIVNYNTFNGPANKVCNAFKIGGQYTSPKDAEIDTFNFEYNKVYSCSSPINLQDENINGVDINGNIFRDTDGTVYIWAEAGTTPSGVLSNFVYTNNNVDSTNSYGLGISDSALNPIYGDDNFGGGNRVNGNKFADIPGAYGFKSVSILTLSSYTLNAENNWWGDNDPSDDVSSGVDYTPWYVDADMSILSDVYAKIDDTISSRASQTSVDTLATNVGAIEAKLDGGNGLAAIYSFIESTYNFIFGTVAPKIDSIEAKLDDETRFTDDAELGIAQSSIESTINALQIPTIPTNLATESVPGAIESGVEGIEAKLDDETRFTDDAELSAALTGMATESNVDAVETKVDAIESKADSIEGKLDDKTSFTDDTELDVLDTKIDAIGEQLTAFNGGSFSDMGAKIDAVEAKLDGGNGLLVIVAAIGDVYNYLLNVINPGIVAIETKADSIEGKLDLNLDAKVSTRASQDSVGVIEGKLDTGLDVPVGSRASQDSVDAIETKADALATDVGNIEAKIDALNGGSFSVIEAKLDDETRFTDDTELGLVDGKVDAIEGKLDIMDPILDSKASQTSVEALSTNVQAIQSFLGSGVFGLEIIKNGVSTIESEVLDDEHGLAEIKSEVKSIENAVNNDLADKDDIKDIKDRIDDLEDKIESIEAKLDSLIGGGGARCGNGIEEGGEQCDDGNNLNGDGCSGTCLIEQCGNGRLDYGEECDDNNLAGGDGCNQFCKAENCDDDSDCPQGGRCNDVFICVGGLKTVIFRTNVQEGKYFKCGPDDNCWIALDFDNDGNLDALGFDGKSLKCNGGTKIVTTPEGFDVFDYGHSSRVRLCDGEGREIRFSINKVPQDVELSKQPTEPFTSNEQETLV